MSSNSDVLIEYNKESLEIILNILKHKLPQTIRECNFVHSYLYHYDKINKNRQQIYSDRWNVKLYGPRYGKIENCTIITITGRKDYMITAFTLEESKAELVECLQKTNLINWQNKPFDIMCDEHLFKAVNEVACQKCNDWLYPPMEYILYITKQKIQDLPNNDDLPEDLYLSSLDAKKHSNIINDHWYYRSENSLYLIQQSIEMNGGIGLFRKGQEQPICWITTNAFFTPGFLHTLESERKQGFGYMIMKLELKRLLNIHNIDLFSFVSVENKPSLALHYKLGFETVNRVTWIEKPM